MRRAIVGLALSLLAAVPAQADAPRDALRAWLHDLAQHPPQGPQAMIELEPARPMAGQAAAGAMLVVDGNNVQLGVASFDDDAAVKRALAELRKHSALLGRPFVILADVGGATPWSTVVHAVDRVARAGAADIAFRFASAPLARPFKQSPIDAELAKVAHADPMERATVLAALARRVIGGCIGGIRAFQGIAAVAPEDKARLFAEGLDEALGEASCVVDPPTVAAWWSAMFDGGFVQAFVVHVDHDAKLRIAAPAHATWHEVTSRGQLDKAFAHAGTRVAFSVR